MNNGADETLRPFQAVAPATPEISAEEPRFAPVYAGLGRRGLAFWMDLVIIAFFIYIAWTVGLRLAGEDPGFLFYLSLGFYIALFPFAYFVIFHSRGGQTPGKMAFKIKVVEQSGARAGALRSVFRAIGCLFSFAFFMAGYLWPLFDRRSQAWHDKIAGTVVLEI